jgi:hypothetical protein
MTKLRPVARLVPKEAQAYNSSIMRLLGTVVAVWSMLIAGSAHAADVSVEVARQHYNKAVQLYDLGHFDDAIGEFEKAYEAKQDPVLLYNLAQSHRRLGKHKRALDLYKNFLRRMPETPFRAEVEARISSLQKLVDEDAARATQNPQLTAPPAAISSVPAIPAPAAAPVATAPAVASPASNASAEVGDGRGLRIAGWATAGAGVVAVAGGVLFGLRARSMSDRVTDAPVFQASDESSGKDAVTFQWVCYGVGAAALATGGVLLYLAWPRTAVSARAVAVAPALYPAGAGVVTGGRF